MKVAMDSKALLSLLSVVLGWFLAQGATLLRDWWTTRKLRRGLLEELGDVQAQLERVVMIHARNLQIYGARGMASAAALPIQNMLFQQHFKDAFSHLKREQRLSYQLIHASIENLNSQNAGLLALTDDLAKEFREASDETQRIALIDLWGDRAKSLYLSAMELRWHVARHLQAPTSPALDLMGPMHASYLQFRQDLEGEMKKVIDGGKHIKREDFSNIYDPGLFSRGDS
jgi:hypothetical protein